MTQNDLPQLKVVAVSGGLQHPSRTLVLAEAILAAFADRLAVAPKVISLADIATDIGAALYPSQLTAAAQQAIATIEQADVLIVATPVYRGAYAGLFKHLFDLVGQDALIGKPVFLAATGGSPLHALVIEHHLRPLFSFFQSLTLPLGVYGSEADFENYQVSSAILRNRIDLAVDRAVEAIQPRRTLATLAGNA